MLVSCFSMTPCAMVFTICTCQRISGLSSLVHFTRSIKTKGHTLVRWNLRQFGKVLCFGMYDTNESKWVWVCVFLRSSCYICLDSLRKLAEQVSLGCGIKQTSLPLMVVTANAHPMMLLLWHPTKDTVILVVLNPPDFNSITAYFVSYIFPQVLLLI